MNKPIKTSATEMNKRIDETKKEIAQLSEELNKLINSNINKKQNLTAENNELVERKDDQASATVSSETKTKFNIASSTKLSKPVRNVKDSTIKSTEQICKKPKTYNQEAAKEYIRQQREKWMEERKKNHSKTNIDRATIKQNLNALNVKSRALVQRNVQIKKERSRTISDGGQIRLDRKVSPIIDQHPVSRSKSPRINTDRPQVPQTNQLTLRQSAFSETNVAESQKRKSPSSNSIHSSLKNITFRNPQPSSEQDHLCKADQHLAATKIQAFYRGHRTRRELKEHTKSRPKSSVRINSVADTCLKESKETQTSLQQKRSESPLWHHTVPIDPYPCNFINTIKRKLQLVVNSPVQCRDVGVQGSIKEINEEQISRPNSEHSSSELDSFLSHKRTNLDVDALKHLALLHRGSKKLVKKQKSIIDSDSDTSKNIPEISTESGSVSMNREKVFHEDMNNSFIGINTDNIDKLHLQNPILDKEKSDSGVRKSYTFNFYEDETENSSPSHREIVNKERQFPKSPRDSIISFNKSGYDSLKYAAPENDVDAKIHASNTIPLSPKHSEIVDKERNFLKQPRDSIISSNKSGYDSPKFAIPENEVAGVYVGNAISPTSGHKEDQDIEKQSDALLKSPADSLISFNKSEYDVLNHNGSHIASGSSSVKLGRVSKRNIVEDIESSINTSLVSSISEEISGVLRTDNIHKYSKETSSTGSALSGFQFAQKDNTNRRPSEIPTVGDLKKSETKSQKSNSSHASSHHKKSSININKSNTPSDVSNENNSQLKLSDNTEISTESLHSNTKSIASISSTSTKIKNVNIRNNEKFPSPSITLESIEALKTKSSYNNIHERTDSKELEFVSLQSSEWFNSEQIPQEEQNSLTKSRFHKNRPDNVNCNNQFQTNNLNIDNDAPPKSVNSVITSKSDSNEIHSKFEAEVHLLNDFNESLKQFMAVEKAFETIKSQSDGRNKKENRGTEISKRSIGLLYSEDSKISLDLSKSFISSINLSRGTDFDDSRDNTLKRHLNNSTGQEISIFGENPDDSYKSFPNNMAGLSIKMFEQLIRDEDVRIENLKTIIKIREQALLDRTKGELAWLEIQRKHLKETGKLHEASLVKKKQRGILLKHQQERREMQRLKQLQKTKSNERKTILKEQQNLIKAKLTSEKIMTDLKKHTPRRKKSIGPMRVLKSSEHSETSVSKKESDGEEIFSVTSTRSRSIQLSEIESFAELTENNDDTVIRDNENLSNMKRALLMRQSALMKRRRAVEDLLQRHQKLLQEEKKIEELEMAANAIIMQMPTISQPKQTAVTKLRVKGQQLNEIGLKMNAFTEKKFVDNKTYNISQTSYNKLFVQADTYQSKQKTSEFPEIANQENVPDSVVASVLNNSFIEGEPEFSKEPTYSPDFELDTQEVEDVPLTEGVDESNLSSISELIQDFSKIEHGISMLSKQSEDKSSTSSENISESIKEVSVIETNKTTPRTQSLDNDKTIESGTQESSAVETNETAPLMQSLDNDKTIESKALEASVIETNETTPGTQSSDKDKTMEPEDLISQQNSSQIEDISGIIQGMCLGSDTSEAPPISEIEEKEDIIPELDSQISEEIPVLSKEVTLNEEKSLGEIVEVPIDKITQDIIVQDNFQNEFINQTSDIPTEDEFKSISISSDVLDITKSASSGINHKDSVIIEEIEPSHTIAASNQSIADELSSEIKSKYINEDNETIINEKTQQIEITEVSEEEENEVSEIKSDYQLDTGKNEDNLTNKEVESNETHTPIISEYDTDSTEQEVSVVKPETPKVEECSTDISEKLSTDSDHIEIQEISPSQSSSDNYTDDFEDESPGQVQEEENSNSQLIQEESSSQKENNAMMNLDKQYNNERNRSWSEIPIIMLNGEIYCDGDKNHEKDIEAQLSPTQHLGDDKGDARDFNVKERVSEILANTVDSPKTTEEKTVRCQDYYVTTYEDITPSNSPESESSVKSSPQISPLNIFGNEAQELLKKQLAIEQEIKHLEQQQKEQLPFVYMREIPNKPPPPYTPPSSVQTTTVTILPSKVEDLNEICSYSAKVLYNAYLSNNLSVFTFSESDFKSINQTKSTKECCLFVFDLCREVAEEHYRKFEKENVPSWFRVPESSKFAFGKPFGYRQLEKHINSKVKELLGFEKPSIRESSIIKWNRKKKDHVDEILVLESQIEEREWLNYDKDELVVKNEVTNQIFDLLLNETLDVFRKIFS